jgi:hypothetical protein
MACAYALRLKSVCDVLVCPPLVDCIVDRQQHNEQAGSTQTRHTHPSNPAIRIMSLPHLQGLVMFCVVLWLCCCC